MSVDLLELAARLRAGALHNARNLGYAHGDAVFPWYRREAVFAGDDELGDAYDAGFARAEAEAADEWLDGCGDGVAAGRFCGVFVRAAVHDGTPGGISAAHEFVQGSAA